MPSGGQGATCKRAASGRLARIGYMAACGTSRKWRPSRLAAAHDSKADSVHEFSPSRAANPGSQVNANCGGGFHPVAVVARPAELSAAAAAVPVPPASGHQRSSPGRPLLIAIRR